MAPVYDFRHVELDKIGRGKRVIKPPGGDDSDIFGVRSPQVQSSAEPSTPRRVKNYQQSSIFTPSEEDLTPTTPSSGASTPTRRRMSDNSQERLFGSEDVPTPRRVVDRMKSNIFSELDSPAPQAPAPASASKKFGERPLSRNPITGDVYHVKQNGHGGMNGYSSNGSTSPVDSPPNGHVQYAPGGRPSGGF
ncbi:microtubule-associated protein Jupiter isoform X2 [Dermacentor silvarum]|uniref:microtubule-associated protein Jupiter isoform X2 n=1 Tax=Dermacentor silvarum TaxID=543639 RepID=UPI00189C0657|nr:microtubule-associated protein Jupiter isoform X2 [Dermacentor silvarum]XP_049521237.1 microtubule-associated protein Jupiter isoform X1 [Dermacentor silvarum]XP_049521238.1 microtubule-associated protein Jupiter isoform X2 [Dermacentor silvarum]